MSMKYVWILGYVLSVLFANVTLDWFIALPLYGQLSVGTLFFAFIFTLRDRIHSYGLMNVFLAIGLALVVTVAYAVWDGVPARFIIASFVSILVGELADTLVFQNLKRRNWLLRCLTSNVISVPLDSCLFTLMAFYGDPQYPMSMILEIIYADVIIKYAIAALIAVPIYFGGVKVFGEEFFQHKGDRQTVTEKAV